MSRGCNQKLKLFYLAKIMKEKTDEEHRLTMPQILHELEQYGVTAERKSVYADFRDMSEHLGIEVMKEQVGKQTYYYVANRKFELAEVKLLVDAVQSSKFITQKKSQKLIAKIKGFVSDYQGRTLQRQVFMDDRIKTMNESVFYNVDKIYNAINENRKIRFKYYKWNIQKKLVPRKNNDWFVLSPWGLTWMDENYSMIAYDEWDSRVKSYRVDKMKDISLLRELRSGKEAFTEYDMSTLSSSTFSMYGGPKKRVHIRFENRMCGVFLDRFGKDDIHFEPIDENWSELRVDIHVSQHFFGWLFGLGTGVKLTGPEDVVADMKSYLEEYRKSLDS